MFDTLPSTSRNDLLDEARCLFFDHRHDISDAARLIAGVQGEARVIALDLRLGIAVVLDDDIPRDLARLCDLLALEDVQVGDPIETFLLSGKGPASREVETTCKLTDLLEDLLSRMDAVIADAGHETNDLQTITTTKAA
jgi:hypothetical protein